MLTLLLSLAFGPGAGAADFKPLPTPRGAKVQVTTSVPKTKGAPIVMIAPGQGCGERPFYEVLRQEFDRRGWAVVRFQYAYCAKDAPKAAPAEDLGAELEDFETAYRYAVKLPGVDARRVAFAGKSLGSMVAFRAFRKDPKVAALALLTPVCTYTTSDDGKPLAEPKNVFADSYPAFSEERRPVVLAWGDKDDLCHAGHLFSSLRGTFANYLPMQFLGDHSFALKNAAGAEDESSTAANQDAIARFTADFIEARFKEKK